MIQEVWEDLPRFYHGIAIDAFVALPNHRHGIIILVGAGPRARPDPRTRPDPGAGPCFQAGCGNASITNVASRHSVPPYPTG